MSRDASDQVRWLLLIDAAWQDNSTLEELTELEDLLLHNAEARRLYAQYAKLEMDLWMMIRAEQSLERATESIDSDELVSTFFANALHTETMDRFAPDKAISEIEGQCGLGDPFVRIAPSSLSERPFLGKVRRVWNSVMSVTNFPMVVLAVSLIAVSVGLAFTSTMERYRTPQTLLPRYAARPMTLAQVTATHHVQWRNDATSLMEHQILAEGDAVEIAAGCLELTFKNGARIVLSGPAVLVLNSPRAVRLEEGTLFVELPAELAEFAIDTPTSRFVGNGNEMGVKVVDSSSAFVECLKGAVDVFVRYGTSPTATERVSRLEAGKAARVDTCSSRDTARTAVREVAPSNSEFVRTLRPLEIAFGSQCIGRQSRDHSPGTVCLLRDATKATGTAKGFRFYSTHPENDLWVTPIILAHEQATDTYTITGIGQSVLNLGGGVQNVPFQLVAGSGEMRAGVHTFGLFAGIVDRSGRATSASAGAIDYNDIIPEQAQGDNDSPDRSIKIKNRAEQSVWLFTPGNRESLATTLFLGVQFSRDPKPDQVRLSSRATDPDREYSANVEIVCPPSFGTTIAHQSERLQEGRASEKS